MAGITAFEGPKPRVYDFRHTFATECICRWMREGRDIDAMLPFLSAYMGHARYEDTLFHKVSPGHYLLFFKANQADAITAAFQKYSAKVLNKEQDKASILGQLRKFTEQIRTQAKEKQRTREAVKDGR